MSFKLNICFSLLFYLHYPINRCIAETRTYISTERPVVNWFDPKCFKNVSVYSKRISRRDPKHYVEVYGDSLITLDNNIKLDFYFYQFLTNRYQPSFVELHFRLCDSLNSDTFIGRQAQQALGNRKCPFSPGIIHVKNMLLTYVPIGFPFTKGRIYCNASITEGGVSRYIGGGSIDMEVKVVTVKKDLN